MQRFLIITTNCALLVILLIGLPTATRTHWGNVQLSSVSTSRTVMYCGLGIAAAGNFLAAIIIAKGRKAKILCLEWAAVFGALLLAEYGFVRGYLNFNWLKESLLWLQRHF
jgi:hypothetical protein